MTDTIDSRRDFLKYAAVLPFYFSPTVSQAQDERSKARATLLLKKADDIRFPKESFEVSLKIKSSEEGGAMQIRELKVWSKGNENTIVQRFKQNKSININDNEKEEKEYEFEEEKEFENENDNDNDDGHEKEKEK